jgi:hypothetical protein
VSRFKRNASLAGILALALSALAAAPALAAPELSVHLERDTAVISRSDQRIVYIAKVENVGDAPTAGSRVLELEAPGGEETFVFAAPAGCAKQPPVGTAHAIATCTTSAVLAPGASESSSFTVYPGPDAPDLAVAVATASGGGAVATGIARAVDQFTFASAIPFAIEGFKVKISADPAETVDYTKAGGHPVGAGVSLSLSAFRNLTGTHQQGEFTPVEHLKDTLVDSARGFVGNALTVPVLCEGVEDVLSHSCPEGSKVGGIIFKLPGATAAEPIYSIVPEFGTPAQFAFPDPVGNLYTFKPILRADEGYAISFEATPPPERANLLAAAPTLCGFGLKSVTLQAYTCYQPGEAGANPLPLITNPTRCAGPPPTAGIRASSWEHPSDFKTAESASPQITECEEVPFEPQVRLTPTNRQADTPTGLDVEFTMPDDGLLEAEGVSQASLDNAIVTFPKGMTLNPAAADGLSGCSLAQIKFHSNHPDECPANSNIGTVEIDTPIIRGTLTGNVYLAKQNDNPFHAPIGVYMDFASARDGVRIKVAGKLTPDPVTGQLVSTFTENPEDPFSRLVLHFNSGPHAPLINPPSCGTYAIHSELSPWSAANPANPTPAETVSHDSTYEVSSGPNGGPCPAGNLEPKLKAGLKNPTAGAKSPFVLSLSREDGTQHIVGLSVANPLGLTAYLAGIPYCPGGTLASIPSAEQSGAGEIANPSCPAASLVGSASAGSGAGPFPFYVNTGRVYLAGPYKGAPVSLAVVTPAVAGPFDLGNVVTRVALQVNPETAQVTAVSDPIPTALHDIALDVRDIQVALDRPNFTAAPTNCEAKSVQATVTGEQGATATVSNRFQVGGCESLAFKPKLHLRLQGGTHRGAHPKLRATLTYPPGAGYANTATASVALPHSEFLDQAHIKTICTRVQFAAKACPAGSIYGEAEASTPLLDQPLRGPVYLRSSSNPLPDLVIALKGPDSQPIEVLLDGRVDSVNGGIRTTFDSVPDQPVSSFTLNMQGGSKGLLVNSRDICKAKNKATAVFGGQNGRSSTLRPVLRSSCGKKAHKGKHKRHGKRRHYRGR